MKTNSLLSKIVCDPVFSTRWHSFSRPNHPRAGESRGLSSAKMLQLLAVVLWAVTAQAEFYYTTNNGTITLGGACGDNVSIPGTINGMPVTTIGLSAFGGCSSLTNVTIPDTVTLIGYMAFSYCDRLTNITIPSSVMTLGGLPFYRCFNLRGIYFEGDAPSLNGSLQDGFSNLATVYCLPGTKGWGATFGGRPTAVWVRPSPVILRNSAGSGIRTNVFGFLISWATNVPVVAETSTDLAAPGWSRVATNFLTNGSFYFTDPQWTNYPARYYRVRPE